VDAADPAPAPESAEVVAAEVDATEVDATEVDATEVVVEARRREGSATDRTLDRAAIEAMPGRSADDLLRAMPGMHISAHGGHGKAYQFFLRGFDAVHGSDIAVSLEGVPLNEVSNVHGHGYLDLHFIPPILVRGLTLSPGTWRADVGDFAVAGSADLSLGLEEAGGQAWIGGGTDRSGTGTLAWRPARSRPGTFLVADVDLGQGVGEARAWRQARAGAGWQGSLGELETRAYLLAYDGVFESPGVLREDDLAAGAVDFTDAYPGAGGGASRRLLGTAIASGGDRLLWRLSLYGGWRELRLVQNYTGYYGDTEHGDGSAQSHAAGLAGARLEGGWAGPAGLALKGGLDGRGDLFTQTEEGVLPDGEVWERRFETEARQADLGVWLAAPWSPVGWLRLEPGLRAELLLVKPEAAADGLAWAPVLAPKAALSLSPDGPVTGFASYGRGFRSPEARGTEAGEVAPVALSDSGELGARARPTDWLELRAAGFATLISDEILFDHAAARFLATGGTRRLGIDSGATLRPIEPLRVEADLTWSEGSYVATDEPIPYAPRLLVVGGVYTDHLPAGPLRLTLGLRGWLLGPRPLPGGFSSHRTGVLDLSTRTDWQRWSLDLDVDNVLGTDWKDGEFIFPSHWDLPEPRSELPARQFTAGAPRVARLSMGRSF
jgi:outer membrane receptor protein involved in Fe transport